MGRGSEEEEKEKTNIESYKGRMILCHKVTIGESTFYFTSLISFASQYHRCPEYTVAEDPIKFFSISAK